MKKKMLMFLLIVALSVVNFGVVSFTPQAAAAAPGEVYMNLGEKTKSSSRITVKSGQKLKLYANWFRGDGVMTVFKNGSYYQTFVSPSGGGTFGYNLTAGPGEYSLRLYCGSPTSLKTNCSVPFSYIKPY